MHPQSSTYALKGMLSIILYQLRLIIDSETFQKIPEEMKVSIYANTAENRVLMAQKDALTFRKSLEEYLSDFEFFVNAAENEKLPKVVLVNKLKMEHL